MLIAFVLPPVIGGDRLGRQCEKALLAALILYIFLMLRKGVAVPYALPGASVVVLSSQTFAHVRPSSFVRHNKKSHQMSLHCFACAQFHIDFVNLLSSMVLVNFQRCSISNKQHSSAKSDSQTLSCLVASPVD